MYLYNSYNQAPKAPSLTMEAFVAPANFDPDAQELNIVKAFAAYPDVNKKYIFSVGTSATTVLPAVTGRSYAYAENGGAYTTIVSGTITWEAGSTKRNVVVIDPSNSVISTILDGSVWLYCSSNCYSIYGREILSIKYIHCENLVSITAFSFAAFYLCSNLKGVLTLPSSIVELTTSCFESCSNLINVIFPSSITKISNSAFQLCEGLVAIEIPSSVTIIDSKAFRLCSNLTSVVIPATVSVIGEIAFASCSNLVNINIPSSISVISGRAFYLCSMAKFNENNIITLNNLAELGGGAFDGCYKLEHVNLFGSQLVEFGYVTGVTYGTFHDCINLSTIIIPSTVNSMLFAFEGCTGLMSISEFKITPPTNVVSQTFNGINKTTCILHVPVGSLAAYQAAQYWNEFTNIIADL